MLYLKIFTLMINVINQTTYKVEHIDHSQIHIYYDS